MILAIKYAREQKIPFLGICLGFQLAVIEWARNVLEIPGMHIIPLLPIFTTHRLLHQTPPRLNSMLTLNIPLSSSCLKYQKLTWVGRCGSACDLLFSSPVLRHGRERGSCTVELAKYGRGTGIDTKSIRSM